MHFRYLARLLSIAQAAGVRVQGRGHREDTDLLKLPVVM
jgi:hypothetical protein